MLIKSYLASAMMDKWGRGKNKVRKTEDCQLSNIFTKNTLSSFQREYDKNVLEEMLSALFLHSIHRSVPLQIRPKYVIKFFLVVIHFKPVQRNSE